MLSLFDTNLFSSCSTKSREKFNQNLRATSSNCSYFMHVWILIIPPRKEEAIPFVVVLSCRCELWHTKLILEQESATGKIDQILMEDNAQMCFFPVINLLLWRIHLLRIWPNKMCCGDSEGEHKWGTAKLCCKLNTPSLYSFDPNYVDIMVMLSPKEFFSRNFKRMHATMKTNKWNGFIMHSIVLSPFILLGMVVYSFGCVPLSFMCTELRGDNVIYWGKYWILDAMKVCTQFNFDSFLWLKRLVLTNLNKILYASSHMIWNHSIYIDTPIPNIKR